MIKLKRFFVHVFACFLIPAYTLLFAGSMRWFGTNFSVIAVTGPDHYRGFIYWGVLAGGYFFVMLSRLAFTLPARWERVLARLLAVCAVLFLIPMMVSTALEVFFTISAALLTRRVWLLAKF